jgi:hypothetical protein
VSQQIDSWGNELLPEIPDEPEDLDYEDTSAVPDAEPFIEDLASLIARVDTAPAPRWLIRDLLPADGIAMLHAQPREFKSLVAQSIGLAASSGGRAFGLLPVEQVVPVWYVTEEDSWHRVGRRLQQLVRGAGLAVPPVGFHISADRGIDLDSPSWQDRVMSAARNAGYGLTIIDPVRSLTGAVDQGPRELKPFARFLREYIRETKSAVLLVHHDAKPLAGQKDDRRRPQRASGGGIFSIADHPIHVDRVDDRTRVLVPSAFKFSADPAPITVTLETGPDWLRLVGQVGTTPDADTDAALDAKILAFLEHAPYSFTSAIRKGVQARNEDVKRRLEALKAAGRVGSIKADKGIKWLYRRAA